jgi:hypothetical protein
MAVILASIPKRRHHFADHKAGKFEAAEVVQRLLRPTGLRVNLTFNSGYTAFRLEAEAVFCGPKNGEV